MVKPNRTWIACSLLFPIVATVAATLLFNLDINEKALASFSHSCKITTNHYDISGVTLADLKKEMLQVGPTDSQGIKRYSMVSWKIAWQWPSQTNGLPDLANKIVSPEIVLTLPKWVNEKDAVSYDVARWSALLEAMNQHERVHLSNACAALGEVEEFLEVSQDSVPALTAHELNNKIDQIVRHFRNKDYAYDEQTQNGRKEGIVINAAQIGQP